METKDTLPAYDAMCAVAEGKLVSFKRDLHVHDKGWIEKNPIMLFAWVLRSHGTHIRAHGREHQRPSGSTAEAYLRAVNSSFDDILGWYVWDGRTLVQASDYEQAAELLAAAVEKDDFERRLKEQEDLHP